MDIVMLLRRAREVGLRIEPAGDKLVVRGPKQAEPVVKLLAERKKEVLAVLADTAHQPSVLKPAPHLERVALPAEGEPGLEEPCPARRGQVRQVGKAFLHFCSECGRFGPFGYGVSLRTGRMGHWYCAAHRP